MTLRLHGDTLARGALLDFAVNVWPARPAELDRALERALARSSGYPDETRARDAVAARHSRRRDEVLLLNGACEAFWLLAHALRPKHAAVVHPSFTEAEAALVAVGCEVERVFREPEAWTFDPAAVPADAELVVVGNPNNPTGGIDPSLQAAGLVVVDASFSDFVPFEPNGDVVIRSLTKLWSLAGIRAGYLLAPAEVVARLEAQRQPWSVNALACAALELCAADAATPARVAAEVAEARAELLASLESLPLRVWPGVANFLLVELEDGHRVVDDLHARGIAVRPCASFPGLDERYIRIAVRTRSDNEQLVAALAEVV
ncbi:MAG: aminotransferase class I/II-fold pyridoxal phosphate-dependent enzyme [Actinomycetia bacterium]|nr:aminotransferase class I/II-fold pyridoxal phosphate-dependent enzyme [Actinomycetes bacterium]